MIRTQREYVEATYGGDMPFLSIIVTAKSPGDNVLTKLFFDDLWRVDALVKATAGPVDGIDRTFEDVCFRSGNGLCEQTGVLNFWNNSVSTYNATVSTDADLLATVNGTLYSNGQSVTRAAAFGSPVVTDGSLSYARSVSIMYLLANANDGFGDDKLLDYADAFLDEMEVSHDAFTHASVLYLAYNSIDNELATIGSDTTLYALCIAILFIVLTLVLGRTCSRLHSRVLLSMGGILSVSLICCCVVLCFFFSHSVFFHFACLILSLVFVSVSLLFRLSHFCTCFVCVSLCLTLSLRCLLYESGWFEHCDWLWVLYAVGTASHSSGTDIAIYSAWNWYNTLLP